MKNIVEASIFSLEQLKTFLLNIQSFEYTKALPVFSESSIGMHNRHIIEFYLCLLKCNDDNPVVNYDARERNLLLETNVQFAVETVEFIIQRLHVITNSYELTLVINVSENNEQNSINSNTERELVYLLEHTIHHLAILKMGCIVSFPHIPFPPNFGVAYSTIKHKEHVHGNLPAN